ncbi:MAG: DUF4162 domain-containing protein [Cytophagia bacterium]|nr:DUF4162 domain-containing protein [Cytophagia bacterium]
METVEDLCTDVVLIHQAGVVLAGPTQAVRRQHSGNQIEIHCAGDTASPPPAPPAHTPVNSSSSEESIHRLVFEAAPSDWPAIIAHYNQHSRIVYFAERLPSFQDIFIKAVGPHHQA